MKAAKILSGLLCAMLLVSCVSLNHPPPTMGMTEQALIAKSGNPTARYPDGKGQILEYSSPWSQQAFMARFGADGRLVSWEQVRTSEKFAAVQVGRTTKAQILRTFGHPAEKTYLSLRKMDVWSYRYKQDEVRDSMMHVHFDQQGVVQQMLNGPDPMYDTTSDRGHGGKR